MYKVEIRIEKITDRNGEDRTDGRYPYRIGRVGYFYNELLVPSCRLGIMYIHDTDGSSMDGLVLLTSPVQKIQYEDHSGTYIVTTKNSVYYLKRIWKRMDIS